jgi:hypothetical protein
MSRSTFFILYAAKLSVNYKNRNGIKMYMRYGPVVNFMTTKAQKAVPWRTSSFVIFTLSVKRQMMPISGGL